MMPKTVSMTAPMDVQAQEAAIARQRRLAEMLQQQSMEQQQGQTVPGGFYVPPSPVQGVAKLVQALVASNQQESADRKQSELSDRQRQSLVDGLTGYQQALQGTPAETFAPDGDGMGPTGTQPAVPGNRQAALAALLKSGDPMLQQIGAQQMLTTEKPAKWSTTPQYDQDGNAFLINEMGERKTLDGVRARDKLENVNGVWQNPYTQAPNAIAPADPNKPFAIGPDGKAVPNAPYQQYELSKAKAGKTDVNVSQTVNSGDKKYAETRMTDRAKAVAELEKSAENAYKQIQSLDRFVEASEKGTAGGAQPLITGVENLVSSFGYSSESLKDSRIMEQAIGDILGSKMAELGARGLTDKDMQILRDALPRVATDRASRTAIANILKKSHVNTLAEFDNQRAEEARIYPELASRVPEPLWYKSYKNQGAEKSPVNDLLKKYGGK